MKSHAGSRFWIRFPILALVGLAGPDLALAEALGGVGLPCGWCKIPREREGTWSPVQVRDSVDAWVRTTARAHFTSIST